MFCIALPWLYGVVVASQRIELQIFQRIATWDMIYMQPLYREHLFLLTSPTPAQIPYQKTPWTQDFILPLSQSTVYMLQNSFYKKIYVYITLDHIIHGYFCWHFVDQFTVVCKSHYWGDNFSPRMPCQWYVGGGGKGKRRILIGQSVPPPLLEWHSDVLSCRLCIV
jgi:hypothetical protein